MYKLSPLEGESEIVLRQVAGTKEYRFPIGEAPRFGAGARTGLLGRLEVGRVPVLSRLQGDEVPAEGQEEGHDHGRPRRPGHGRQDRVRKGPRPGLLGRQPGLHRPPSLRPRKPGEGEGQVDRVRSPRPRAGLGKGDQHRQRRRVRLRQGRRAPGPAHRRPGPGRQRPPAPGHGHGRGLVARQRQGVLQVPGLDGKGRSPGRPQGQGRQGLRGQALERPRPSPASRTPRARGRSSTIPPPTSPSRRA